MAGNKKRRAPPAIIANLELSPESIKEARRIAKEAALALREKKERQLEATVPHADQFRAFAPLPYIERKNKRADQRAFAGLEYITNPGISVSDLRKYPSLCDVPAKLLDKWAAADKWVQRRTDLQRSWQNTARAIIGSKIAERRLRDLELMDNVQDDAFENLMHNDMLMYRSKEGAAGVFAMMIKHKEELRAAMGTEMFEQLDTASSSVLPKDDKSGLEAEEIQEIARRVVEERRFKQLSSAIKVVDVSSEKGAKSKDE